MENEYTPVEPNYYNYKAKELLVRELSRDVMCYDNIRICAYHVNNEGKYPFLRFLLTSTLYNNTLTLPHLPLFNNLDTDNLIIYTKMYLSGLLMINDPEKFTEELEFDGFYDYNNVLYVFVNITKCNVKIDDTYKSNHLWLTMVDEIVNYKHVCNIKIDPNVVDLFTYNDFLCFLLDDANNSYETPVTCYVGKPESKLNFTFIFGEIKKDKNEMLGPYYYFKDFYLAFKDAILLKTDNTKSGLVRFSIFVGNTKYIQNNKSDPNDESEIKIQRFNDESLDQNMERLTMRISDHDGNWTQNYDSVYLGEVELDNGILLDRPILVVKEYKQQIPLSYHFIDKRTVNFTANDYSIM